MKPAVAILGAGPSGLALARLLTVKNITCIVFEREKSPDAVGQGGCLDIHSDSGQLVLKEGGLFDKFKSLARYDGQASKVVDRDGVVTFEKKYQGQEDRPEIDRKDLRRLLLDSVPSERIRWDARVESVNRDSDGSMAIRFANGGIERGFQLVVGADGTWSKARSMVTSATPRYSGLCYLQTAILPQNVIYHKVSERVGTGSYMALSSGKQIVAQRQGDGSYNVYVGLRLAEHWSRTEAHTLHSPDFRKDLIKREFSDWSSNVTDLIKHSDGAFYAWNLYAMPIESFPWKSVPGVTLIGDAAHVSTPFQGEGVNCAMFDSFQLANDIAECGIERLDEAVRKYEDKMFPRAIELITRSEENGRLLFANDALEKFRAIFKGQKDGTAEESAGSWKESV